MDIKGMIHPTIYPYSEWEVRIDSFVPEHCARNETVFSLGNGYIGFRGNFEEEYDGPQRGMEGTYLNGFYESGIIRYGEIAYGYPEKSQTMLNVANAKRIRLFVDGELFDISCGEIREYGRTLSMREGILNRRLVWWSPGGKQVRLDIERLVSLTRKHIAAIRYTVTPLNFSGRSYSSPSWTVMWQISAVKKTQDRVGLDRQALYVADASIDARAAHMVQKTRNSRLALACCMMHRIETENAYTSSPAQTPVLLKIEYRVQAAQDTKTVLYKYISYVDSNDFSETELVEQADREACRAWDDGYQAIRGEHRDFLNEFWRRADIEIDGDPAMQQGIRFNLFHLLQSTGSDGKRAIGAKGLTGEGYEGHYFWDTEMYVLPFFLYSMPERAKGLLEYRYNTLDQARERARQLGHGKGALYPWRTINGEECSANYPSGTAQYHIDADIAYAVKRYMDATRDDAFLMRYGAEILFETARFWADLGAYIPARGNRFCINGVTGPDEYNAVVNNNCYTNMMAQWNMKYAYRVAAWMQREHPGEYRALADRIGLTADEPPDWKRAADSMYIPYDDGLGIHLQDDAFLERAPWDFAHTPADRYPLLLHYHPLVIYRHQVCKQADLVLALLVLGDRFTEEQKKKNYDFYEKCTTHDSSLSEAVFSIMASEIGYYEKAYRYFSDTVRTDLDDSHDNTKDGIHAANMAGSWMCISQGFAGMRHYGGELYFKPYLPEAWGGYRFNIEYRGCLIRICVDKERVRYVLLSGDTVTFSHGEETIVLDRMRNETCRPHTRISPGRIQGSMTTLKQKEDVVC